MIKLIGVSLLYLQRFFLAVVLLFPGFVFGQTRILVLGDSLTEGYGIEKDKAFPTLMEKILNNDAARKTKVRVINAGISGSTTASGLSRLKWQLRAKPDLVILALGSNDGLRGFKPAETKKNVSQMIELLQEKKVKVVLTGIRVPPNYGKAYIKEFEKVFPALSKKYRVPLMPFLLKDVAGEKALNLPDGIHPNEKGHEKIAKNLSDFVRPLI